MLIVGLDIVCFGFVFCMKFFEKLTVKLVSFVSGHERAVVGVFGHVVPFKEGVDGHKRLHSFLAHCRNNLCLIFREANFWTATVLVAFVKRCHSFSFGD